MLCHKRALHSVHYIGLCNGNLSISRNLHKDGAAKEKQKVVEES